nr:hypothetical protein [uncultured Oscillibacter sp.]
MPAYFPDVPPDPKLSAEEKRRIARRFRRKANLTDSCLLLGIVLFLLGAVLRGNASLANFLSGIALLPLIAFAFGCLFTYHAVLSAETALSTGNMGDIWGLSPGAVMSARYAISLRTGANKRPRPAMTCINQFT